MTVTATVHTVCGAVKLSAVSLIEMAGWLYANEFFQFTMGIGFSRKKTVSTEVLYWDLYHITGTIIGAGIVIFKQYPALIPLIN